MAKKKEPAKQSLPAKRAKLERELGKLTYEMTKLRDLANEKARRCNEIGTELEKLDGK